MEVDRVFVGLGANLGDAAACVVRAIEELGQIEGTCVIARSSLYRTAPVGKQDQPDFVNAVVRLSTSLGARELLDEMLAIETRHGRVRTEKNGPRTLDLDLLLYGNRVEAGARMTLPHPRMHERAFVLLPLNEIAPGCEIPGKGAIARWLPGVAEQGVTRIAA